MSDIDTINNCLYHNKDNTKPKKNVYIENCVSFYELRNIPACTANENNSTSQIVVWAYGNSGNDCICCTCTYKKKTSCEDTEERLLLILIQKQNTH